MRSLVNGTGRIECKNNPWTKYQKNVEASHNKGSGMKPTAVTNCIRSENYVITFEVEEEKFPLFGKKYQLKFANDITSETHCLVHFASFIRLAREAGLEYVEIQNLTEFYDDNRCQPPILTPNLQDGNHIQEDHEWLGSSRRQQAPSSIDEERPEHTDANPGTGNIMTTEYDKGILGPGPSDLRFSDLF
uniref:mRNA (guanine-N(7))-methyltransferase n=1 Tax=Ananas comosus var. bracteatus TaxID=296719 RepID=A0A6V7PA77_ANACO|nr:unnamed protein product [Ananas comosus var. bracteatus]